MACTGRPNRKVVWPERLAKGARTDHIQDTAKQFCTVGVMPSFTELLPAPDCPNLKLFGVRNIRSQCQEYPVPMSGISVPNVRNIRPQCPEYPCPMPGIFAGSLLSICAQCLVKGSARTTSQTWSINSVPSMYDPFTHLLPAPVCPKTKLSTQLLSAPVCPKTK